MYQHTKAALGVQLAEELAGSYGLHVQPSERCVDVFVQGFAFRLHLHSARYGCKPVCTHAALHAATGNHLHRETHCTLCCHTHYSGGCSAGQGLQLLCRLQALPCAASLPEKALTYVADAVVHQHQLHSFHSACKFSQPAVMCLRGNLLNLSEWCRDAAIARQAELQQQRPDNGKPPGPPPQPSAYTLLMARSAHHALASAVADAHPMFASTARLAKRWLQQQLLTRHVGEEAAELLVAAAFTGPSARQPPGKQILCRLLQPAKRWQPCSKFLDTHKTGHSNLRAMTAAAPVAMDHPSSLMCRALHWSILLAHSAAACTLCHARLPVLR